MAHYARPEYDSPMKRHLLIPSSLLLGCVLFFGAQTFAGKRFYHFTSMPGNDLTEQSVDWTEAKPAVPKGKVEFFTIADKKYNRNRKIWVYTPPNYNPQSKTPYNLLLCFDGSSYISDIPAPTILDNLLAAGKIPPTVAVLVDNETARLEDLANRKLFADYMADELLPWVRKNYPVTADPAHTTLGGYSAGGLAAAYVAFQHPELFGNVLSQSGAFWRGNEGGMEEVEWLTAQFKNTPKRNLRFYIEVGALETGKTAGGPVFIEANQRLRQVLEDKGYEVRYLEVANARHEPAHWRLQLANGLIYLSGQHTKIRAQ